MPTPDIPANVPPVAAEVRPAETQQPVKMTHTQLLREAIANDGRIFRNPAVSPSMLGSPLHKAWLLAVPQQEYRPKEDVVIFKNMKGTYTHHRVTAVKPGYVYTKGDFNQTGDGWIPLEKVVGRIELVLPGKVAEKNAEMKRAYLASPPPLENRQD